VLVQYQIQIDDGKIDTLEEKEYGTGLQTAVTTLATEVDAETLQELEQTRLLRRRLVVEDVSMPSFINFREFLLYVCLEH